MSSGYESYFLVNSCHHILVKVGSHLFFVPVIYIHINCSLKLCIDCNGDWFSVFSVWRKEHFIVPREIANFDLLMFTLRVCILDCRCRSVVAVGVKDMNGGSVYTISPSFPCTRPVRLKAGFGSNSKSNLR
jgi:hypothetical protein